MTNLQTIGSIMSLSPIFLLLVLFVIAMVSEYGKYGYLFVLVIAWFFAAACLLL